jgi:hypothetical protein
MKQLIQPLFAALLMAGLATTAEAQVKFKLSRLSATTYQVSMVPEQTLTERQAIVSTMQVSLKLNSDEAFVLADLKSANDEVLWDNGAVLRSPDGAAEKDYVFVGLKSMATRAFSFEKGVEVPLFTFRNGNTEKPATEIQLVDNEREPLSKLSYNHYNVGNHISVLGYGMQNAWRGNLVATDVPAALLSLQTVFPNPARDEVTVAWDNYLNGTTGAVTLTVSDSGSGRTHLSQSEQQQQGRNTTKLNVSTLDAGIYLIHLERDGKRHGEALKLLIAR